MSRRALDRVVVVGNGIAGLTAADTLREAGFDGRLTILGDERHAPYSRPALSKAALLDSAEMTSHRLPAPSHGGEELLGATAARVDLDRRVVVLDDGEAVPFDGLVIATGSRARRLGGDPAAELTLRSLDDAIALRRRLADRPAVAVLGGGPLGMELASGCLERGCEVVLVSPDPPLVHHLGAELSGLVGRAAERRGLRIAAATATGVRLRDGHPAVALADGTTLDAELVVTAVGDLPNVEWLASSGLLTGGALRVDARGRLTPEVVAAGDVATIRTPGGMRRLPLWTSAIEQARVAALALLRGDDAPELELRPYFWTEQFGLALKASGPLPPPAGAPEVIDGDPDGDDPRALLRWARPDGSGTAVAINHRTPVPRLRRLASEGPTVESPAA